MPAAAWLAVRGPRVIASLRALAALLVLGLLTPVVTAAHAQQPAVDKCAGGQLQEKTRTNISTTGAGAGESQPDLQISGVCKVKPGKDYYYSNVNIIDKGELIFEEGQNSDPDKVTNFWARSIIVENGGAIKAGTPTAPYGTNHFTLNIVLYGKDQGMQGKGAPCVSTGAADCGIPDKEVWETNGSTEVQLPGSGDIKDYFYQYGTLMGDKADPKGHYGYKVLAVGYGGTLQLFGKKGATGGDATADKDPAATGTSWVRLALDLPAKKETGSVLTLDRKVEGDWQPGDKVVVTTTDYLPSHSEELTIAAGPDAVKGTTVTVEEAIKFPHRGTRYDLSRLAKAGTGFTNSFKDAGLAVSTSAETRAAVALLTRSIRIVSGGDSAGDYLECPGNKVPPAMAHNKANPPALDKDHCATERDSNYSFGGHTLFRQGFTQVQVQGVEFHQLGQGGRMGHYPVHFHTTRKVPTETYVKDSSVSESMTRWYVLHSTQGVLLQRNVGWKSIGHGYYLETGTETDNKFYANIGILARAAVQDDPAVTDPARKLNPRNVPGILASNADLPKLRYRSDIMYPTVFWITNGWNDFVGNMAAGAGTCGMCYWYLPAGNSDMVETQPTKNEGTERNAMKWSGYAGRQIAGHDGETPVKLFYKNYCTTAMHSLNTSDGVSDCLAVRAYDIPDPNKIAPVKSMAPPPAGVVNKKQQAETYYPTLVVGNRVPSTCNDGTLDCDFGDYGRAQRCDNTSTQGCGTTVIDHYTTSFHWAETNFSAVWLRTPGWFLMDGSFISDVQNAGLTFVSGGDYSRSSAPTGYWALVSHSVFAGATQPGNYFADAAGPRSENSAAAETGCVFASAKDAKGNNVGLCLRRSESIYFPLSNWATGQRLFNIYDGPAHQNANAYLDINISACGLSPVTDSDKEKCMYLGTPGVRKFRADWSGKKKGEGFLPNAAIGWKQPNGFYYPPAFDSANLFFDNVDIRHYVIQPLYKPRTYVTDDARVQDEFVGIPAGASGLMTGFTDIDRQTELTDDDGTLTGFKATNGPGATISVNEDGFFTAPVQAAQCKSNPGVVPDVACAVPPSTKMSPTPPTARTSPYEYVTTVIYPGCAIKKGEGANPPNYETSCGTTDSRQNPANTPYDNPGKPGRYSAMAQRGGSWSRDCAGPYCFGVPIYRQYLVGDKSKPDREWKTWSDNDCSDLEKQKSDGCDFPFARMSGAAEWQRNIMTVNNGKYYIDTTRSPEEQRHSDRLGSKDNINDVYVECDWKDNGKGKGGACEPRSVNVFEAGQTYYVFLMFAKPSTKQTYQIYVGKDFKPEKDLKGIKIVYVEGFFGWDDWEKAASATDPNAPLYGKMIEGTTKDVKDVLEVTVDFSKLKDVSLDPKDPKNKGQLCHPNSFCTGGGASCGCHLDPKDVRGVLNPSLKAVCKQTCSEWAVKDLDAPTWVAPSQPDYKTGRLGFAFTLPAGFKADNTYRRPAPEPYPDTEASPWKLIKLNNKVTGATDCTYSDANTPALAGQCKVPDCAPGMGPPPFCDKPQSAAVKR